MLSLERRDCRSYHRVFPLQSPSLDTNKADHLCESLQHWLSLCRQAICLSPPPLLPGPSMLSTTTSPWFLTRCLRWAGWQDQAAAARGCNRAQPGLTRQPGGVIHTRVLLTLTAGSNSGTLAYSSSPASAPQHIVFVAALPNATQGTFSLKIHGSIIIWSFPASFKINLADFST